MKSLRLVSLIIVLAALGYYGYRFFGKPNGKTFEIDKNHHVYYKGDGVTEDDARKTADYLKELGLVKSTQGLDVQIKSDKVTDDVKFSLVFDKTKITPAAESEALAIGSELSNRVFNGRKVSVSFVDQSMDEIKNLGYSTPQKQLPKTDQNETKQTDDEK